MTHEEDSDVRTPPDDGGAASPPGTGSEKHIVEPENALPEVSIENLPSVSAAAAKRAGWPSLMPVQAKAIPYMLEGRDLMIQSRTGSGKTGAFLLPILQRIDPERASCQALVLVPTRELAVQVFEEARRLCGDELPVNAVSVYGGVAYGPQLEGFRKGAHIVVGTPGRILDHLMKGSLSLKDLRILVFDEADRMLSMGFYPDMKALREYFPRRELTGYMFSATITPNVERLAGQFLTEPEFLSLSRDVVHVAETRHLCFTVAAMDKDRALVRVIEVENPDSGIIFCNTRASVHYVATVLQRFGYDADEISSDISQKVREKVMGRLRKGNLRFLVATDVAARGIDISGLSHVFQYEVPEDPESYVHRSGRTGRAGAIGTAITLASAIEVANLSRIAKRYGIDVETAPAPTGEDVERIVAERTTALLEARFRELDKLKAERLARMMPLASELNESHDERRLLAMLLDEFYQATHHAAPPDEEPEKTESRDAGDAAESSGYRRSGKRRSGKRGGRGDGKKSDA